MRTTPAQLDAQLDAATAAFLDDAFQDPAARARGLDAAALALEREAVRVLDTAACETSLGLPRLRGELTRTCAQLRAFAHETREGTLVDAVIDSADPDALPLPRPDLRRMLVPLGPVVNFSASNFPLAFGLPGGDTASALAAGCPVLVKGHPSHERTSELLYDVLAPALAGAGLPAGALALAQGDHQLGARLVTDRRVAACSFTGSLAGGRALFDLAAGRQRPIPVYAEMGSVNPLVVTAGAAATRGPAIAEAVAAAVTGSAGQLCTKPGVVLVPASADGERLVAALTAAVADVAPQLMLDARLSRALLDGRAELGETGATRLTPADDDRPAVSGSVHLAAATDAAAHPRLLTECFGPAVVAISYEGEAELLALLERLDGELTATLHGEPHEAVLLARLAAVLSRRVGRIVFDGVPTGVAVTAAMTHGGPYPATTAPLHSAVGTTAARRFLRPLTWQDAPAALLPPELRDENPRGIPRRIDGRLTTEPRG